MRIPRTFEPLSCSLTRLCASVKMPHFVRKYSPGYRSHDLYWENKMAKRKRCMKGSSENVFFCFPFRNIVRKDSMWDYLVFRKIQVRIWCKTSFLLFGWVEASISNGIPINTLKWILSRRSSFESIPCKQFRRVSDLLSLIFVRSDANRSAKRAWVSVGYVD